MATTPKNIKCRDLKDTFSFAVDPAVPFNEGDLMCLDPMTGYARPIANGVEDVSRLLGDAQGTNPVTYHGPIKTVAINVAPHTVKLVAREAAAFNCMTPVFYSTDAQSFVITNPGGGAVPLGVLFVDAKENGGTMSGTTVIGKEYEIMLRPSYVFNWI